jgi:hypothetical protein
MNPHHFQLGQSELPERLREKRTFPDHWPHWGNHKLIHEAKLNLLLNPSKKHHWKKIAHSIMAG